MKFTVDRADFCNALKAAFTAVKNTSFNKLTGVYLSADADRGTVQLIGTDIITSVIKRIKDVQVNIGGEVIVPGIVLEILRRSKDKSVTLETDENNVLRLSFGTSRYDLPTRPVEEFPKADISFPTAYVSVTGLLPLINHASFAAETKGEDRQLQGVKIRLTTGAATAEAMNKKRMALSVGLGIADGDIEMSLHISAVNILTSLINDGMTVCVGIAGKKAVFVCGDTVFSTVMMNNSTPDMNAFIQKLSADYSAETGAKELLRAIETATVCQLSGDDRCINICLTPTGIKLSCAAYGRTGAAFVPTLCASPTPENGFNYEPQIILDFLKVAVGSVTLGIDKRGFMLLSCSGGKYIVTPRTPVKIVKPKEKAEKTPKEKKQKKKAA